MGDVPTGRGLEDASEAGSAPTDFVLVGGLLTLLFLSVVQLAFVLHVRNTLIDAAASGARYGSLADRGAADAEERASELAAALGEQFGSDVTASYVTTGNGTRTLQVRLRAPLPLVGFAGPPGVMEVEAHAPVS